VFPLITHQTDHTLFTSEKQITNKKQIEVGQNTAIRTIQRDCLPTVITLKRVVLQGDSLSWQGMASMGTPALSVAMTGQSCFQPDHPTNSVRLLFLLIYKDSSCKILRKIKHIGEHSYTILMHKSCFCFFLNLKTILLKVLPSSAKPLYWSPV
jgi:hypothetical protein